MTEASPRIGGLFSLLALIAIMVGGFVAWALLSFGPRDIPANAPACPSADWAALNAQGVEFGSVYNSTDRAERNDPAGVLPRQGDPHPRCIQIFGDKTCNLVGPTTVQVNRPDGPVAIQLEDGQQARLHNNPGRPFRCGLLNDGDAGE